MSLTPRLQQPYSALCLGPEGAVHAVRKDTLRQLAQADPVSASYIAASLAAVTGWVQVPTMGDFPFAHLA